MKRKKIGSLTLALTLIILGIILLVNIYIPLDIFKTLRIMFASSIILLGVEFIFYEWFYKKSEQAYEVKISALAIIVLIIIYGSSFTLTGIQTVIGSENGSYWFRGFFEARDVYEFTENYTENAKDLNKLLVDNGFGHIDIERGETNNIEVEAVIQVRTYEDEDYAANIAGQVIKVDKKSSSLTIKADTSKYNHTNINTSVNFVIKVPKHLEIDLDNGYGNVYALNIDKSVNIINKHGSVRVEKSGSDLTIENSYGNVDVVSVMGITKIENKHGKVEIEDVENDLTIKNEYDSTSFDNITGNVILTQIHGNVEGSQIGKNVEIKAEYCPVKIVDVGGKAEIKTSHNAIDAKNIASDIKFNNQYGNISIEEIGGNIDINSQHSEIDIYNPDRVLKNVDIDNTYGNISFNIPDNQEGNFELRSDYGNIDTNINLSVDVDDQDQTVKDSIGNSTNNIIISTSHGDIRIR